MIIEAEFKEINKVLEADFGTVKVVKVGGDIVVDQTYNPESENAQSGKAVAEAIRDKTKVWKGSYLSTNDDNTSAEFEDEYENILGVITEANTESINPIYRTFKVGDMYIDTKTNTTYMCIHIDITKSYVYTRWQVLSNDTVFKKCATKDELNKAIGEALEGDY